MIPASSARPTSRPDLQFVGRQQKKAPPAAHAENVVSKIGEDLRDAARVVEWTGVGTPPRGTKAHRSAMPADTRAILSSASVTRPQPLRLRTAGGSACRRSLNIGLDVLEWTACEHLKTSLCARRWLRSSTGLPELCPGKCRHEPADGTRHVVLISL